MRSLAGGPPQILKEVVFIRSLFFGHLLSWSRSVWWTLLQDMSFICSIMCSYVHYLYQTLC